MSREANVVIKLREDLSTGMNSMRKSTKDFNVVMDESAQKIESHGKQLSAMKKLYAEQQTQLAGLSKELAEAKKAYRENSDAANATALTEAQAKYNDLKEAVSDSAKAVRKARQEYLDLKNAADGAGQAGRDAGKQITDSFGDELLNYDIAGQIGSTLGELGGTLASSLFGSEVGSALSSTVSSAVQGGMVAGVAGALAGGVVGLISSLGDMILEQFEYATQYANELYDESLGEVQATIDSGSGIAATRETDRISFSTLFGGEEAAGAYLTDLQELANTTPFLYDDLTAISKTLKTFGYETEEMIPTITAVGDAGAAVGLGTSDINTVSTAIGRMKSSDKATLEYLNQLNERGFAVFEWLAEDMGTSQANVYKQISGGTVSGTYAAELIVSKFNELYGGMMEEQSQSYEGLMSTLQGWTDELANAGGEAYNEERKEGLADTIDAYSGTLGASLQSVNAMIGSAQGIMENYADSLKTNALQVVFDSGELDETLGWDTEAVEALTDAQAEYQQALATYQEGQRTGNDAMMAAAGQQVEALYAQTQAIADNQYNASDLMDTYTDVQNENIKAIQDNTVALDAAANAYSTEKQKESGATRTLMEQLNTSYTWTQYSGLSFRSDLASAMDEQTGSDTWSTLLGVGSHAAGLGFVPYDNYPAYLHQGERVLTAAENRDYTAQSPSINVSGNTFVIQGVADTDDAAERVAEALLRKIELAR